MFATTFYELLGAKLDGFGLFLLCVVSLLICGATVASVAKHLAVMLRGWPPCECVDEEEGEDAG